MKLDFPQIPLLAGLIFASIITLACSGSQVSSTGAEAVCGRDRIAANADEKFSAANAKWSGGDGWKALELVKEKIDEAEEKGGESAVDPELRLRRSDWGMRIGAKATARRDVEKMLKHGPRELALLASARYNTFYSKYEEALQDVTARRALLCEGKGPKCLSACDLQRAFLLRRLGRKTEATAAFEQCRVEHRKANSSCGKFGNALTEYFLGKYDAAGRYLGQAGGGWQETGEARVLGLLIENNGRLSRSEVRSLGLRGFTSSRSLEELLVFPYFL